MVVVSPRPGGNVGDSKAQLSLRQESLQQLQSCD
jgi:hypothetical protein